MSRISTEFRANAAVRAQAHTPLFARNKSVLCQSSILPVGLFFCGLHLAPCSAPNLMRAFCVGGEEDREQGEGNIEALSVITALLGQRDSVFCYLISAPLLNVIAGLTAAGK